MKIVHCDQRSPEWFQARLGLLTASHFHKLLTPTLKESFGKTVDELILRLVAEQITGEADYEQFSSNAMNRGENLEAEALEVLEFTHGLKFDQVGFIDSEKGYGCSPDGVNIKDTIGLEMKCPYNFTQVKYLAEDGLPKQYLMQIQGSMLITGWEAWCFFSYHPKLPNKFLIVERDEDITGRLEEVLLKHIKTIKEKVERLREEMDYDRH